jgi:RHS repeat-associated protein
MAVTNYHTVNGRILGETTGGVRTDYLTDALGSVTATVNPSAQVINRYTYKPYGALLAKTGVGADPANQWVGSLGYRQTGKKYSDVYIRARHYDTLSGRWTSKDPIGFTGSSFNLFAYGRLSPSLRVDPSGLLELDDSCSSDEFGSSCCMANRKSLLQGLIDGVCGPLIGLNNIKDWEAISDCVNNSGFPNGSKCKTFAPDIRPQVLMDCFRGYCSTDAFNPRHYLKCSDVKHNKLCKGNCAYEDPKSSDITFCVDISLPCDKSGNVKVDKECLKATYFGGAPACRSLDWNRIPDGYFLLVHEITHACSTFPQAPDPDRCLEKYADLLACCILTKLGYAQKTPK